MKKDLLEYKLYKKPTEFITLIKNFSDAKFAEISLNIPKTPTTKRKMIEIEEKWRSPKKPKNYYDENRESDFITGFFLHIKKHISKNLFFLEFE